LIFNSWLPSSNWHTSHTRNIKGFQNGKDITIQRIPICCNSGVNGHRSHFGSRLVGTPERMQLHNLLVFFCPPPSSIGFVIVILHVPSVGLRKYTWIIERLPFVKWKKWVAFSKWMWKFEEVLQLKISVRNLVGLQLVLNWLAQRV
jgi:hypothetical protein